MAYINGQRVLLTSNLTTATMPIDQTYSPTSENAQSGKAVAQALEKSNLKLIKTITLEEAVKSIDITFDKGLKEIAILMNFAFDGTENSKALYCRSDGGGWYMFYKLPNLTTEFKYVYAHAKEICERQWEAHSTAFFTTLQGITTSTTNDSITVSERPNRISRYLKNLNIETNSQRNFVVGTTIEIWGVEAE